MEIHWFVKSHIIELLESATHCKIVKIKLSLTDSRIDMAPG